MMTRKRRDRVIHQEELLDKYMELKEKEWTLWFDAESHLLKKVSFDSSVEDNFTLYLLSAQILNPTLQSSGQRSCNSQQEYQDGDE
ncbi:MAG: hypothetical protein ACLTT1_07270 [[Clostridium] scindens]